jgi:Membrane-bound serine protease (ClpP class)
MLILAIILLILVGVALLVAEFFVFVGSVVAGVAGFALTATGVFLAYKTYGTSVGNYTLIGAGILFLIAVYFALRSKTWKKIALHSELDGKVNTIDEHEIKVGDKGVTVSKVAPMGKVRVNDVVVEAKSTGIYIEENTDIEVIKVYGSNILVKPLK